MSQKPSDLITTNEARRLLGISPNTMSQLIKDGKLKWRADPLDKRVKLVSRAAVLALKVRDRAA